MRIEFMLLRVYISVLLAQNQMRLINFPFIEPSNHWRKKLPANRVWMPRKPLLTDIICYVTLDSMRRQDHEYCFVVSANAGWLQTHLALMHFANTHRRVDNCRWFVWTNTIDCNKNSVYRTAWMRDSCD